jgi:hypothetical protein
LKQKTKAEPSGEIKRGKGVSSSLSVLASNSKVGDSTGDEQVKRGRGRPLEHDWPNLLQEFEKYIYEQDIPSLTEFAVQHRICRQKFYERPEFRDAIARCHQAKELGLEDLYRNQDKDGAVTGRYCEFALQQLGWRKNNSVDHSGELNVQIVNHIAGAEVAPDFEDEGDDED